MLKQRLTNADIEKYTHSMCAQMDQTMWRPDIVVGLTRGGLVPANMISQYFDVPLETLKVKLRDLKPGEENESKHHLADLAHTGKHVLVVDDINDTGATLNHICRDWETSFPNPRHWRYLFNTSVKFAMLVDNKSSKFSYNVDYYGTQIDKSVEDVWVEFPWEVWWEQHSNSSSFVFNK